MVDVQAPDYPEMVEVREDYEERYLSLFRPSLNIVQPGYTSLELNTTARNSPTFRRMLARRADQPINVLSLSDSIGEGYGVTIDQRWINLVVEGLRSYYQPPSVPGGEGYVPGFYQAVTMTDRWITVTGSPTDEGYGLGRRAKRLLADASVELTFVGTGFQLFYATASTGVLEYSIDGSGFTTVAGTGSANTASTITNPNLSDGEHTLTVRSQTGGGSVWVHGAMVFRGDYAGGVRLWDGSKGGMTLENFIDNFNTWDDDLIISNPQLAIVSLGANDAVNYGPEEYGNKLAQFIDLLRETLTNDPTIIVVIPHRGTSKTDEEWAEYRRYGLTAGLSREVTVIDMAPIIGPLTTEFGMFNSAQNTHMNANGHRLYADSILFALIGATAPIISNDIHAIKLVDTIRNNTTDRTADPELTIPVDANSTYTLDSLLIMDSTGNVADFRMEWLHPSGSTMSWWTGGAVVGITTSSASMNVARLVETDSAGIGALTSNTIAKPNGVLVTGSTAGSLTLSWAQNTLEASDLTLFAGSWIKLTKIN